MEKMITNKAIWTFFAQNNIAVAIRPRENDWYVDLYHTYANSSAGVKDGIVLVHNTPSGRTPEEAFENMCLLYSGLTLRFENWIKHEGEPEARYEPIEVQFPVIIKVGVDKNVGYPG